jgi:hypothetical protein
VYKSTGNQYFTLAALKEAPLVLGLVYLKKYQEEHIKVSIVSVSLRAGPEHLGHVVLTNDWQYFRGDSPVGLYAGTSVMLMARVPTKRLSKSSMRD